MKRIVSLFLSAVLMLALLAGSAMAEDNLTASIAKWEKAIAETTSTDGQLLMPEPIVKEIPERPEDPEALAEDDAGHYFDMEYVGFTADQKSDMVPASPADGCIGKHVIVIVHGDSAWTEANKRGWEKACEALGMTCEIWSPNWDQALQNQLVEQAINAKPDAIAMIPVSAEAATQQFRKIAQAGIPAFCYNTLTTADAMQYMVSWSGPDDWAQMRQVANVLGEALNGEGGVAYITHMVGISAYYARCYGPITELKKNYPNVKTLDIQSPGLEAADAKQVVADWITRFGDELKAVYLADDGGQATGTIDAIKESGRSDILVVSAGNSKTGQDLVKSGDILCINYLPTDMITAENVDGFYPTQW